MTKLSHILEAQQFSKDWLEKEFFPLVSEMKKMPKGEGRDILRGKEMISLFYGSSIRTRLSFEVAMRRLGGEVIFSADHAKEFSPVPRNEAIEDIARILSDNEPDIIVLRTEEEGMVHRAAEFSTVPIINAGDGMGQHPTQALLDFYTIQEEIGRISGTAIALVGDLNRDRSIRSFAYLYANCSNTKIYLVSPEAAKIRDDVKKYLGEKNVPFEELYDLREVASLVDVVYQSPKRRGNQVIKYGPPSFCAVNQEVLDLMKKEAIVMHPMPHEDEIAPEVDLDPRAAYFRQARNRRFVYQALLKMKLV